MVNGNFALKSAPFFAFLAILCLLLPAGCADTKWPTWFTGEPDESVLSAPRAVRAPPSLHDKSWPNLATVPGKPDDFTPLSEREEQIRKMERDREEARNIQEMIESEPVPEPPPPPSPFQIQQP
ncbi:MAG: hypothetical protein PHY92_08270 [Alphaproteobacteria bacterium]|nr:hypothetical protein [Alphaproteobacteria bacterium]